MSLAEGSLERQRNAVSTVPVSRTLNKKLKRVTLATILLNSYKINVLCGRHYPNLGETAFQC